jgi:hypothetical protein
VRAREHEDVDDAPLVEGGAERGSAPVGREEPADAPNFLPRGAGGGPNVGTRVGMC